MPEFEQQQQQQQKGHWRQQTPDQILHEFIHLGMFV